MDLTPLTTPNNVLTDCLNGTIITFNGNEFTLQNDMGNCKVDTASLKPGFIPLGMKEYDGIIYVASYNPLTEECEFGSFPSPQRDFSTTDFTDLSPVELKQTDFILENGITHEKVTTIIGKLFEPELFQIHPGDLYVVTYTLNEPAGGSPSDPNTIDTDIKYANFISKDPTNRKLFRLNFYKITDDNNLVLLDGMKLNIIKFKTPLLDADYAYFTENSKSAIAVGLEIEPIDYFDANVIDTSLRTDSNKSVTVEALGYSNSLSDFKGVKVDFTEPSAQTFYLERKNMNGTKKVSGSVSGLSANNDVQCTVTPYSAYCLYPKLAKNFKLTLGQYLTVGSGINNLFRYYLDPTGFLQIDFDYRFQGNTNEGIHLYVELYDPWSNYSIIKTVDNPTYYGINSVILNTVTEPRINQFDSTTVGGTDPNKLITNPDTDYEKSLLNSTNKIRIDQAVRTNHFYIIRVSGVDKTYDTNTQQFTYQHYDFYKGLYTNDMFNADYLAQGGLSANDPGYIADFNSLDFDLSTIKYDSTMQPTSAVNLTPVVTTQRDDLTTNSKYYKISPTVLSTTTPYKYTKTYETKNNYSINLTLSGTNYIFGTFKTSLVNVGAPTLQRSDGTGSGEKATVVDTGWDSNSLTDPGSLADWTLTSLTNTSYTLLTDVTTNRSVVSSVIADTRTGFDYQEVPLAPSLYYRPNGDAAFTPYNGTGSPGPAPANTNASVLIKKYDLQCIKQDGSLYIYPLGGGNSPNDATLDAMLNAQLNTTQTFSAFVMTSEEPTWGYGAGTDYNSCNDGGVAAWKECNMLVLMNGVYHLTKTIDLGAIVDFFNTLFVASNVSSTLHVYYPSNAVSANGQVQTVATYPDLAFTTNFTPNTSGPSYIDTYLSTFTFHALGTTPDFSDVVFNSYIASRQGTSVILDNKNTIRKGFIPYINTPTTTTGNIAVPPVTINQAADNTIVTSMINGSSEFTSDPAFQEGPRTHGTVFTTQPAYQPYVNMLAVGNVHSGVVIAPTGANAAFVFINPALPQWNGHFAFAGRCKGDNICPSLVPAVNITKA